jgi:predicted outer membrane lipoprotein
MPASGPPYGYQQPPYGQPGVPPPYQPPLIVMQPTAPTSGLAVTSLVLSLVGLLLCCAFGIPSLIAVICGHLALRETKSGAKSGQGMAVAGLVMGYLIIVPAILFSLWVFALGGLGLISSSTAVPQPTP